MKPSKKAGQAGSLEEVVLFATTVGATEKAGLFFWYKCEGSGWLNAKQPIKNWRATFCAWWEAEYFPRNCYPAPEVKRSLGGCGQCGTEWIPDKKGGLANFCPKHEGICSSCCPCLISHFE